MEFLGLGLFGLIALAVWVFGVIDVLVTPPEEMRYLQKPLWVLIVLIGFGGIGAAFWFVYGRPPGVKASVGSGGRTGRRGVGPDDDVDFLRSLNRPPDGPA